MKRYQLAAVAGVCALIATFFLLGLNDYLSLDYLKTQQAQIRAYYENYPGRVIASYFFLYVAVAALSLPGAGVMTLAGGAIFGLVIGTLIVSFASAIGATLAFLTSRLLLRDWVQNRYRDKLKRINEGIAKEGAFYLFGLRLVIAFPFFVINLLMGLTPIRAWTFYWVSQVGMLCGTVLLVYAGTQLGEFKFSIGLVIALALLGFFPLIAKRALELRATRRIYSRWKKPKRFDFNLVVIGAGAAGLVTAYLGAALKAKVALIEKDRMGGDCLSRGCVPSKALIRSAKLLAQMKRGREYGIRGAHADFSFADVMDRVQRVISTVAPHDSVERYTKLGVECIAGTAKITTPWTVAVKSAGTSRVLTARSIVIAAGGRPVIPPIPGIEKVAYLTSDTVWELRELPRRLLILGGGAIGCELAQCFARFGSEVTVVEMAPTILAREDVEISRRLEKQLTTEAVQLLTNHRALNFNVVDKRKTLTCEHADSRVEIEFDVLLCAVGRVASIEGYGLEELGIEPTAKRTVGVDDFLRTVYPNIYACGDVAGPFQFTHAAGHQAWHAAVNALFSGFKKFRADYSVIPSVTFTDPEIGRVGLNERDACAQAVPYEVTTYDLKALDRAIIDEAADGVIKVLTVPNSRQGKILGATIVAEHAGEIISEVALAMRHGLGLNHILATVHSYPTLAEANRSVAGEWKRAHQPERLLEWVERYHAWMRR